MPRQRRGPVSKKARNVVAAAVGENLELVPRSKRLAGSKKTKKVNNLGKKTPQITKQAPSETSEKTAKIADYIKDDADGFIVDEFDLVSEQEVGSFTQFPDNTIAERKPTIEKKNIVAPKIHWTVSIKNKMNQVLSDAFLPVGFPDSVTKDYLAYQIFDSLQAFFSTITSLLASRAVLQGLGVGDATSSATYAVYLTVTKDCIARLATIIFAYRYGRVIEPDAKRYRFLADVFNDSAFFLDLASPFLSLWPKVLALTAAEALRAICGVAAGASKAALAQHFAINDNLGELSAKEASQETAVGLLGLLVGTLVIKFVEDRMAVLFIMIALVFLHLFMNYLGVRCVVLQTLNPQRATILLQYYLKHREVLTPAQVAARESVLLWRPILANQSGIPVARVSFAKNFKDAMPVGAQPDDDIDIPGCKAIIWAKHRGIRVIKLVLTKLDKHDPSICPPIDGWFTAVMLAWFSDETDDDNILQQIDESDSEDDNSDDGESFAAGFWKNRDTLPTLAEIQEEMSCAGWDILPHYLFDPTPRVKVRFVFPPRPDRRVEDEKNK